MAIVRLKYEYLALEKEALEMRVGFLSSSLCHFHCCNYFVILKNCLSLTTRRAHVIILKVIIYTTSLIFLLYKTQRWKE